MARYIVIHQIVENFRLDEMLAMRKKLYAATRSNVEWRNSWYIPATNELICEWEAPTGETVRDALTQGGATQYAPIKIIHEVVPAGPTDFPGEFGK